MVDNACALRFALEQHDVHVVCGCVHCASAHLDAVDLVLGRLHVCEDTYDLPEGHLNLGDDVICKSEQTETQSKSWSYILSCFCADFKHSQTLRDAEGLARGLGHCTRVLEINYTCARVS